MIYFMILVRLETKLKKKDLNTKITLKRVLWVELWPFKFGSQNKSETEIILRAF